MKLSVVMCAFLMVAVVSSATPIDVYFVGSEAKAAALFREGVDNKTYNFLIVKKKDFPSPRLRLPYHGGLPKELRTPNKTDKVIAAIIIDNNGKVIDVAIVETSDEKLNQYAKSDLSKWVFTPAKKDGKTVACCVFQPCEYNIKTMEEVLDFTRARDK